MVRATILFIVSFQKVTRSEQIVVEWHFLFFVDSLFPLSFYLLQSFIFFFNQLRMFEADLLPQIPF